MNRVHNRRGAVEGAGLEGILQELERTWSQYLDAVGGLPDADPARPFEDAFRMLARVERDGRVVVVLEITPEASRRWRGLSPRERQIATLVGHGWTSAQIAQELGIREKTVKTHLARVFSKLAVQSRAAVASLAAIANAALSSEDD